MGEPHHRPNSVLTVKMKWKNVDHAYEPAAPLTSHLGPCLGTETLETVKCGTGEVATPVSVVL